MQASIQHANLCHLMCGTHRRILKYAGITVFKIQIKLAFTVMPVIVEFIFLIRHFIFM